MPTTLAEYNNESWATTRNKLGPKGIIGQLLVLGPP